MKIYRLSRQQFVPRPIDEVFAFFSNARNLEAITPPWLSFRIVTPGEIHMQAGTLIEYEIRWRFVRLRWLTQIRVWSPPREFTDVQLKGPYSLWEHTHRFEPADGGTRIHDLVAYALPFGPLGRLGHALRVRRDLDAIFAYRAQRIDERFARHTAGNGRRG